MVPIDPRKAAKRVLEEAPNTPQFFDLSEAERLIWMLERAFMLGVRAGGAGAKHPEATRQVRASQSIRRQLFGSSSDQN
jgi:hypothetical protein